MMTHKTMTYILIVVCVFTLFTNCKRNHYYCQCLNSGTGPYYQYDYGTHYSTKESELKKECDTHNTNPTQPCILYAD
jgi:hypothetical protein